MIQVTKLWLAGTAGTIGGIRQIGAAGCVVFSIAAWSLQSVARAQPVLTLIEPEGGYANIQPVEINDSGEVLITRLRNSGSPTTWSAIWQDGVWRPLSIPSPIISVCPQNTNYPAQYGGWLAVRGGALNNNGTVAGGLHSGSCSGNFMATWSRNGSVTIARQSRVPDCLYPYPVSGYQFTAIGDNGTAGGSASGGCPFNAGSMLTNRPSGFLQDAASTNGIYTTIKDINASGVAVGGADGGGGNPHMQLWTSPSSVTDLGPGTAIAINDLGWVLTVGGIWRQGVVTPLNPPGTPSNFVLNAVDINDVGSILGTDVVEVNGTRYRLSSLGLNLPGYQNISAVAINNRNWIIGQATLADGTNRLRAWLLKPNLVCFTIITQPASLTRCAGDGIIFSVTNSGTGPFTFQWRKGGSPINTTDNASAATDTLTLSNISLSEVGSYDCIITNACGSVTSDSATLTICIADFNCDGGVDGADVGAFFDAWEAGSADADVNDDGGIDGGDVSTFFEHWEAGC